MSHKLPNDKEIRKHKENHKIRRGKSVMFSFSSNNEFLALEVTIYARADVNDMVLSNFAQFLYFSRKRKQILHLHQNVTDNNNLSLKTGSKNDKEIN